MSAGSPIKLHFLAGTYGTMKYESSPVVWHRSSLNHRPCNLFALALCVTVLLCFFICRVWQTFYCEQFIVQPWVPSDNNPREGSQIMQGSPFLSVSGFREHNLWREQTDFALVSVGTKTVVVLYRARLCVTDKKLVIVILYGYRGRKFRPQTKTITILDEIWNHQLNNTHV